ncbi:MAG: hypothetical protein IKM30_08020 [Oscillospiraceae bacterium]|nr:hypothetical protein [Oscillospiraceae bacterium]
MSRFLKQYARCLIWLLLSEILCLILAFSFAILSHAVMQYLSLFFGVAAHCLLMGNCGQQIAKEQIILYRQKGFVTPISQPLLLSLLTAVPLWIQYLLLLSYADSTLVLNLYLLLNAPVLQINRLILNGTEPFAALSLLRKLMMAALTLIPSAAVLIGYLSHYPAALAEERAKSKP